MSKLHILFDVDGTLSDFHGDVTPELCRKLHDKGAKLWMLSERDDKSEALDILLRYGLQQIPMTKTGRNYVDIKLESLKTFTRKFPKKTRFVYVGDRAEDLLIALMASVCFCSHSALSEEIFEEAKYNFAVLCGGECGEKGFMEAT